jgi:hypothetical protein
MLYSVAYMYEYDYPLLNTSDMYLFSLQLILEVNPFQGLVL